MMQAQSTVEFSTRGGPEVLRPFKADIPKLQLWVSPGLIGTEEVVTMIDQGMKNVTTVYLGEGFHYVQESYPDAVGAAVAA